tara:strand:- start:1606 stop:1890 length:285 start_codon:yes stop_codon:yes gene_type:complete
MHFQLVIKNNISIPTKFTGTQKEFNIAYKKYLCSDSYGKIIDIITYTDKEYLELNNVTPEIQKKVLENIAYMEKYPLGKPISKKGIHKRYHKYL